MRLSDIEDDIDQTIDLDYPTKSKNKQTDK